MNNDDYDIVLTSLFEHSLICVPNQFFLESCGSVYIHTYSKIDSIKLMVSDPHNIAHAKSRKCSFSCTYSFATFVNVGQVRSSIGHTPEQRIAASTSRRYSGLRLAIAQAESVMSMFLS